MGHRARRRASAAGAHSITRVAVNHQLAAPLRLGEFGAAIGRVVNAVGPTRVAVDSMLAAVADSFPVALEIL